MRHARNRHADASRGGDPTVRRTVADLAVRNHDFDCGYDLAVTVEDGERTDERQCPVGEAPEHSVLVECGNGCVAVTSGLC